MAVPDFVYQARNLAFQKGGIGTTISREETVERLNPLIREHVALNHYHDFAIKSSTDPSLVEELRALQKTARADVGKLAETVFSNGGVAYNGTDIEPGSLRLEGDQDDMIQELRDREARFQQLLTDELADSNNHHIRTRAILGVVLKNSQMRASALKAAQKRRIRVG
jgi:hypothetical protein